MSATRLSAACHRPFSTGSEGDAWQWRWCEFCAADHSMHGDAPEGPGCLIWMDALLDFPSGWPEAWLPEPDDGSFAMPSRLVCMAFQPCEACGGDPGAEARAERMAEVTAYWREHGAERIGGER